MAISDNLRSLDNILELNYLKIFNHIWFFPASWDKLYYFKDEKIETPKSL